MAIEPFDHELSAGSSKESAKTFAFAESILDSISPHIAIIDGTGRIIKVNAAWQRFASENGMPPGRGGVGENYFEACGTSGIADLSAHWAFNGIKSVMNRTSPEFMLEYPCHSPCKRRWFLMRARPLQGQEGTIISHDDISQLKQAEESLQEMNAHALHSVRLLNEREMFISRLATNLPGMVGYWDKDLRCRFANKHYHEWFGKNPETMIGITIQDLMGDRLFSLNEPYIRGALSGEDQTFERRLTKADGTIGYTLARYIVDKDSEGHVKGFLALVTDITQIKLAEIQLNDINRQLRLARESADSANLAKSRFLATMSHELRTPLHTIIGFSEILHDEYKSHSRDGKGVEYVDDILASAQHLLSVVNDVLHIAKIESGRMEIEPCKLSVHSVITGVARLFYETALKARIGFKTITPPDLPDVWADERALKQILFNLISNALKFTPAGGTVTITADHADGGINIIVTDTGIGIPNNQIERVLRPFEQLDNKYAKALNGTGLGLSVVQGLVAMHGGKLSIDSDTGKGTAVTISLPSGPSA